MSRPLTKSFVLLMLGALGASTTMFGCVEECVDGFCYPNRGWYYDNLVSGVDYETRNRETVTRTGVTGEDGDPGAFGYSDGDTVSFSLGDTDLGETLASERVTPFDVAGVTEEAVGGCDVTEALPDEDDAFQVVHNLAVLLQTMDTDGDPTTGIEISPEVAALFDGVSIEVDQTWATFETDADLLGVLEEANNQSLFPDTRTLREREEALQALYQGIGLCP